MKERSGSGARAALALAVAWFLGAAAFAAAVVFMLTRPPYHALPVLAYSASVPAVEEVEEVVQLEVTEPEAAGEAPSLADLQTAPLVTEQASEPPDPLRPAAWTRFAAEFANPRNLPLLGLIVRGLGLSETATETALRDLPPAATLSFSPYARQLDKWIARARAKGHEVMLDLPMEPETFPREDPGPSALLTSLGPQENRERLHWVLSRGSDFVGLTGVMGSRFVASSENLAPVLTDIAEAGLIFVDNRPGDGGKVEALARELDLTLLVNDRGLNGQAATPSALRARLGEVEGLALSDGTALAIASGDGAMIEQLAEWSRELESRGVALAPVSALLQ